MVEHNRDVIEGFNGAARSFLLKSVYFHILSLMKVIFQIEKN